MSNIRKRSGNNTEEQIPRKRRRQDTDLYAELDEEMIVPPFVDCITDGQAPVRKEGGEDEDEDEDEDDDEDDEDEEDEESVFDIDAEVDKFKESDPELIQTLEIVKTEIARTEPNVKTMLSVPLRLEDRAKLCQYYEIYKMQTPNTNEWLDARDRYNEMFKEYKAGYEEYRKYSDCDITRMKEEETKFTGFNAVLALKYKILSLEATDATKKIIFRKYEELMTLDTSDDEYGKLKQWLAWATEIPHNRVKKVIVDNPTEFIRRAKERLDAELYGMEKVKEQILLFLSAKLRNPNMVHSNLGLVGPPGTGKTAIARLISEIMGWGFSQISFGGSDKAEFLKGHEYTYIGSQPGEVVKSLKRIGHKNGVIFLDELEKTAENPDIRAVLLHLVDPTQNMDFRDFFLSEIPIDLSQIWWIGSMNSVPEDSALADRWWIIEVKGYEYQEKIKIVENYLLPRALRNCGMVENSVVLSSGATSFLISEVCKSGDKGVRILEKTVKDLVNKVSFLVSHQNEQGKLPFKTSFELGYQLSFPVYLTSELLGTLIVSTDLDNMIKMMYI